MRKTSLCVIAAWLSFSLSALGFSPSEKNSKSSTSATQNAETVVTNTPSTSVKPSSTARGPGIGVKLSSFGIGVETAIPVMHNANIRAGVNMFNYRHIFNQDDVNYLARLNFRSAEAFFDWFPFRGSFHLSPGVVLYNGNQITGNASVPPNRRFTFNGVSYASNPADPLTGNARLDFKRTAPAFIFGWGNLVPRGPRHWSIPVEFGAIYQGKPQLALNFSGSACDMSGISCQPVSSDSEFQSNLQAERDKLNHDIAPFRFYPVISVGLGYKF